MNVVNLQYGVLKIQVESEQPITIPLPLENKRFPLWISPMQLRIRLFPPEKAPQYYEVKEIPSVLCEFYSVLEELQINFTPPNLHCNSWWVEDDYICGYFPYETDRFLLKINPYELLILIYGNELNLNRVILDILSCFATVPPLHGAAVRIDNRTIIMLGQSGCGKTRVMKYFMEHGATYIADEEIFWMDGNIFCCGRIMIEKDGRPSLYAQKYAESDTTFPVTDIFLLTSDVDKDSLPALLPVIARQSFWAQVLIDSKKALPMIERLKVGYVKYLELFNNAKHFRILQDWFSESINEIEAYLNLSELISNVEIGKT
ncbi:MAG: hypothetical protein IJO70_00820 [Lachnospiraceae bacterium]|nr:hypothetical protein [Lachnospiraceae bacterium]